jgi:hypothetical protein
MKLVNQQMPEGSPVIQSSSLSVYPESLDSLGMEGIGLFDVLCGRDRNAFNNVGNRRFRVSVSLALDGYLKASTRKEKSIVIRNVVEVVRRNGGRFLQESVNRVDGTKRYIELDDKRSHEKTGHALRDMALLRGTKVKKPSSIQSMSASTETSSVSSSTVMITDPELKSSPPTSLLDEVAQPDRNLWIYSQTSVGAYEANTDNRVAENWDDASELSSDESVFHDLVRLVAGTESKSKIPVDRRATPPARKLLPVVSDDAAIYGEQDEYTHLLRHESVHPLIHETRLSNNSLVVDDRVLSWLVGEIDFV